MPETLLPEEAKTLLEENLSLRAEVDRLDLALKKLGREMRTAKSFLDKVTMAAEAKDTLNSALEEANIKQRAYTDMLLESCPNIIILLDDNGCFVLSTEILLTVTGTPNFDYIKHKNYREVFSRFFSEDGMTAFNAAVNTALSSGETVNFDALADFSQTGQPRFYSVELRRVGTGQTARTNVMNGILVVMVDLTDLMREKQRAEDANNAKSDFLATMSHEIRTPMNAIIGMSEMLDRSELAPKQKRYVSDIKKSSGALLSIINDILDFSKIEAGKMELVSVNYNLRLLLDNLYSIFSMLCREKKIEMSCNIADDLPEMVFGDDKRLRQILTNLLSNAVKYTREGSITLSARLDENGLLNLGVTDTGIGIREEDKKKLFMPFEQLDVRKNRDVVGTGLGLAITYNLCRLMGGDLRLKSVYGSGSTFFVSLPYVEAGQTVQEDAVEITDFTAPRAKILVVDDIEINLAVAEALLSTFDIAPDMATSGKEAIEMAGSVKYDIIFMDHMMPGMDGLETTKHIREEAGLNSASPIVALTANAIMGMEQMFIDNDMDDFLPKPLEISALNLCLRKWLPPDTVS